MTDTPALAKSAVVSSAQAFGAGFDVAALTVCSTPIENVAARASVPAVRSPNVLLMLEVYLRRRALAQLQAVGRQNRRTKGTDLTTGVGY